MECEMLPLRFELLLVVILVYFGDKNVNGIFVMPYGYDHPYEPHQPLITVPPTTTTTTTTTTTSRPTTTTVEPTTPPVTTTTTPAPVTTTEPPITPCTIDIRNYRDDFLIKYYHQYNYYYPHGGRIPVDRPPIHILPEDTPPDDTTLVDPHIFNHGGLRPRQSAPLRHPTPITHHTTYMSGPNAQGTMVTLVSNSNSPHSCSKSSTVQSQSGMTVGWQGIGASVWRGYNPYNELLNHGRTWYNFSPPIYQPPQVYPID